MMKQLAAYIPLAASLLFFILGACLAFFARKKNSVNKGIDVGEFISAQYMLADVPFGAGITKKMLMRRINLSDFAEIANVPNWLAIYMKGDISEIEKTKAELEKKTDAELVSDTKQFYDMCQSLAERSFVRWNEYVAEWKRVDPEYTGKLDKATLDFVFQALSNPLAKHIKKKLSYNVLLSLQKAMESRQNTSTSGEKAAN